MVFSKQTRRRTIKSVAVELTETPRETLLDIVTENFKFAGRNTYVHRVIFIGTLVYSIKGLRTLLQLNVDQINAAYSDEYLTGIFLEYPKYFCHILEGSEEMIKKFFTAMMDNNDILSKIIQMKLLTVYHHINLRLLNNWIAITARPPNLLEKIDDDSDMSVATERLVDCLTKLYTLAFNIRRTKTLTSSAELGDGEVEDYEDVCSQHSLMRVKSAIADFRMVNFSKKATSECLPPTQLLEFLVNSQCVEDMSEFLNLYHEEAGTAVTYDDESWPVAVDFVPPNVYDNMENSRICASIHMESFTEKS